MNIIYCNIWVLTVETSITDILKSQHTIEMSTKISMIYFSPKQNKINICRQGFQKCIYWFCDYRVNNQVGDFQAFSLTRRVTAVLETKVSKICMQKKFRHS